MRKRVVAGALLGTALILAAVPAHADYLDHYAARDDVGPRKMPYLGDARILLIPVEVATFSKLDMTLIEGFYAPNNPTGFSKYYETASLGRFRPKVTIGPKVTFDTCPLPEAQFPGCVVKRGDIGAFTVGMDMMREVIRKADELGVDFKAYDTNGRNGAADGWVDGVMIMTNTPFGGIAFPLGYYNRGDNLAGGTTGPLIVDGVHIGLVAIAGSQDYRVLVHEFGHLLGMCDLYDETQTYGGLQFSPMGTWQYDETMPLFDAESRFRLRWSNWHQVSGTRTVHVQPAETSGEVWRLGTGNEYFLVENRGPGGLFDLEFKARGLAVYHVDRRYVKGELGSFQDRVLTCVNCNRWHPFIRNLQADGKTDLEFDLPVDYANDLYRDKDTLGPDESEIPFGPMHRVMSSNYYSGKKSGISIRDIIVRPDKTIDVTFEAPAGGCDEKICDEGDGCLPLSCEPDNKTGRSGCAAVPFPAVAAVLVWAWAQRRRSTAS